MDSKSVYSEKQPSTEKGVSESKTSLNTKQVKVYKRRWYVLLIFSLMTFTQACYWNTWGPIAESSEDTFSWTDGDIALFANWGPIGYVVGAFFSAWLVDTKGLRPACLMAALLVAAGSGIRCITSDTPYVTWTVNIGQALVGLAGPIAMGGPPLLSAVWFPLHERTTATSIGTCFNLVGVGVSFLIGPQVVSTSPSSYLQRYKEDNTSTVNSTYIRNTTEDQIQSAKLDASVAENLRKTEEAHQIMMLMYTECGWAVLVFLGMVIYFPSKPDSPPTISAGIPRREFKNGLKMIVKNRTFWLIAVIYSISLGVFDVWQGVLDVNLKPHGFSQTEAGWLGFASIMAGCVSSVIVARFADIFNKHLRVFLIFIYIVSTLAFLWFTLLVMDVLPNSTESLYISIIIGTICLQAATPLYFELGCEVCFPVSEGLTNVFLTLLCNIGSFIFLLLQMIPNIGTAWENWCLLGVIVVCIPMMCLFKDSYNRSDVDDGCENKEKS